MSRKYIADAIQDILVEEGTWMKAQDIAPILKEKVGKKIHTKRIAQNITHRLFGVERRMGKNKSGLLYRIKKP